MFCNTLSALAYHIIGHNKMGVMEEMERAFESVIDSKFAQIEKRIIQMEETNDKIYSVVVNQDYSAKGSKESSHRALIDVLEHNTEDSKQSAKTLEAINIKQNHLIKNTEDLITKTSKVQRAVKDLQKQSSTRKTEGSVHSAETSSTSFRDENTEHNSELIIVRRIKKINKNVQKQMKSWVKYSNENTSRMIGKLISMAKAVEATTVQGKVLHDGMLQKMDTIWNKVEENLSPLKSHANSLHKEITLGGKETKKILKQIHTDILQSKANEQLVHSNDQNLENVVNIMGSLATSKQECACLKLGLHQILDDKLSDEFLRRMSAMTDDQKSIMQNIVDKKALSGINNVLNDIKLGDVKMNMQIKEIKNMCSRLCEEEGKELYQELKGIQTKHEDGVANIKYFATERFKEVKSILQKISKVQTKQSYKKEASPKKKTGVNFDDGPIHSTILQIQIRKASAEQIKVLNMVSSKVQEISKNQINHHQRMANFRSSFDRDMGTILNKFPPENEYKDKWKKLQENMHSVSLQQSNNTLEDFNKHSNVSCEILNSVEDLKILTSSMPNTVNDLVPLIEKVGADISTFPDDINGCFAALEENLCANLEGRVKLINEKSCQEICNRFDNLEQRLLDIRNYVKYRGSTQGGGSTSDNNVVSDHQSTSSSNILVSKILEGLGSVGNVVDKTLASSEIIQKVLGRIEKQIPSICGITKHVSKKRLSMLDIISRQVSNNCKDILDPPLNEICDLPRQILDQQAIADVDEEQFLVLADEMMICIIGHRAIEENLVSFCEKHIELINHHVNARSNEHNEVADIIPEITQMEEKILANQKKCLRLLQGFKSFPGKCQEINNEQPLTSEGKRLLPYDINERCKSLNENDTKIVGIHDKQRKNKKKSMSLLEYMEIRPVLSLKRNVGDVKPKGDFAAPLTSDVEKLPQAEPKIIEENLSSKTSSHKLPNSPLRTMAASPSGTKKRTASSPTEDSNIGTNAEVQDHGHFSGHSTSINPQLAKKTRLDRRVKLWGPK